MTKLGDISTAITSPAYDDLFYIWDTSAAAGSRDGKITLANIFNAMDTTLGFWEDVGDYVSGVATDTGANIFRIRDRVMVADAGDYDGNKTPTTLSWVGEIGDGTVTHEWWDVQTVFAVAAPHGVGGYFASKFDAARGISGGSAIGVMGLAYSNTEDSTTEIWGGYFEAIRGTSGGLACGVEIDIINLDTTVNDSFDPYDALAVDGTTIGFSIASGGGPNAFLTTYPASIAMTIHKNANTFYRGIVFKELALERDGTSNHAKAISLPFAYDMTWYEPDTGLAAGWITSIISEDGHATELAFSDVGLVVRNSNENVLFRVVDNQNTVVNYLGVGGSITGGSPSISAIGADTNLDIRLIPKGAGRVMFGTYTADAGAKIAGYISIKDAAGNGRRLAVVV